MDAGIREQGSAESGGLVVVVVALVEDVAADQPANGAADEDIRREMLASQDAGYAQPGGETVGG